MAVKFRQGLGFLTPKLTRGVQSTPNDVQNEVHSKEKV